jgi:hypothetical protein
MEELRSREASFSYRLPIYPELHPGACTLNAAQREATMAEHISGISKVLA